MKGMHMKNDETRTPISPKVYASGATGIFLFVVLAILTGVTEDMLDFAGQFTPLVYIAVTSLAAVIAGYFKGDPQRIPVSDIPMTEEDVFGAPDEEPDNPNVEDDGNGDTVYDPET